MGSSRVSPLETGVKYDDPGSKYHFQVRMDGTMTKEVIASLVTRALNAPAETREEIMNIEKLLGEIGGMLRTLSAQEAFANTGTETPTGVALDPEGAIHCFVSYRTLLFWKGILEAVARFREREAGTPVQIVDIGSGPYAGLVLPLCTILSPEEVRITVVDIHPVSIQSIQKIATSLGVDDHFERMVVEDGTNYRHPEGTPLHIAVSETMYQALEKEGQVAIFHNIEEQLTDEGVLIPEEIEVNVEWIEEDWEFVRIPGIGEPFPEEIRARRRRIGRAMTLSRATIPEQKRLLEESGPERTIRGEFLSFPTDLSRSGGAYLTTTIRVFDRHVIGEYQNGLTFPKTLVHNGVIQPGKQVRCDYVIDDAPRFILVE